MRWQVFITCHEPKCDGEIFLKEFDSQDKAEMCRKSHIKRTTWCPKCGAKRQYSGSDFGTHVILWTPN